MIVLQTKKDCCGCAACMQKCPKKCISFFEDNEGFTYPEIDNAVCVDCGICEKVCPVLNQQASKMPIKIYAIKNNDEVQRLASSSGGVFTLLAQQVINKNGIVFGSKFDENWDVIHDYTDTIEGLSAFRGSKYVQSKIGETFKQAEHFLKKGKLVLFSGTSCQISGLQLYLGQNYDNLLTVDVVCHGVPSPKIWRMYLDEKVRQYCVANNVSDFIHETEGRKFIKHVNFRDKSTGWKKFCFSLSFISSIQAEEKVLTLSETFTQNTFMKGFLANLYLRPSCYQCPAKKHTSRSDITIADFWGIDKLYPSFDDNRGVSLVLYNTQKALMFMPQNSTQMEVQYNEAIKYNSCIGKSAPLNDRRSAFFSGINNSIISRIDCFTKRRYIDILMRRVAKLINLSK